MNGPFDEDMYNSCDNLKDSPDENPYYAGFVNGCLYIHPELS